MPALAVTPTRTEPMSPGGGLDWRPEKSRHALGSRCCRVIGRRLKPCEERGRQIGCHRGCGVRARAGAHAAMTVTMRGCRSLRGMRAGDPIIMSALAHGRVIG